VHGCFWHGHTNCKYASIPKTRTAWWQQKIETNKNNDAKSINLLKKVGYKLIHIWGCQLKKDKVDKTLEKVVETLEKLQLRKMSRKGIKSILALLLIV
jgi:DNA mismatch endonuclease (patch repair protein)